MRKIAHYLYLLLFLLMSQLAIAQQLAHYGLATQNWQLFNPAATNYLSVMGEDQTHFVDASFRHQWIGWGNPDRLGKGDAPVSYNIRYEKIPKHRAYQYEIDLPIKYGFHLAKDQTDAIGTTSLYTNFAYQIMFDYDSYLSIGLNGGGYQYRIDTDRINFRDRSDAEQHIDRNIYHIDFSLGAFYVYRKKFYLGISVPQTFQVNLRNHQQDTIAFLNDRLIDFSNIRTQHYHFVMGGFIPFTYEVGKRSFLEPSILIRYLHESKETQRNLWLRGIRNDGLLENLPISADAHIKAQLNTMWFGFGFGTSKMIHFELGAILKDRQYGAQGGNLLRLGIIYSYPLGIDQVQLGHTAEILVGFGFGE